MSRRAFTLIELLIVVSIIMVISVPVYRIVSRTMGAHRHFDQRMALQAGARDAIDAWHRDVSLAASITPAPDGKSVVIRQGDSARDIEYVFSGGRFLRRQANTVDRLFANHVVESAFQPEGGTWRLSWTVEDSDGLNTWRRTFGAIAAPLAPAPAPAEEAR
ncbi:prepilin-type N-terminal cleavage/methylation domain-containing protein [bacterium]|nr:prepilin-type N-terminal cleavage/methylation domain-containing protein [bacterium]